LINPIGQALRKVIYKGQTIQDLGVEYQHILRIFVAYCIAALVIVHRGILYRTVKRIRARKSAAAMPVEQKTATSNGG
jgi:hypothetical protein